MFPELGFSITECMSEDEPIFPIVYRTVTGRPYEDRYCTTAVGLGFEDLLNNKSTLTSRIRPFYKIDFGHVQNKVWLPHGDVLSEDALKELRQLREKMEQQILTTFLYGEPLPKGEINEQARGNTGNSVPFGNHQRRVRSPEPVDYWFSRSSSCYEDNKE